MILIINTSNFIFRNKSFIFIEVRFEIANLDFISTVTWRVVRNLYTSISVCILSCYYFCTIGWFLLHCCFTYQSLPFIQHTCFYISMFVFNAVFESFSVYMCFWFLSIHRDLDLFALYTLQYTCICFMIYIYKQQLVSAILFYITRLGSVIMFQCLFVMVFFFLTVCSWTTRLCTFSWFNSSYFIL